MKLRRKIWIVFGAILAMTFLAGIIDIPGGPSLDLTRIGINFQRDLDTKLGLDLQGGAHLVYEADVSQLEGTDEREAVEGARDVIERRVNSFGISEPSIQTTKVGSNWRIIVELAGVFDVDEAIRMIGETPLLEFKEPIAGTGDETGSENLSDSETNDSDVSAEDDQSEAGTKTIELTTDENGNTVVVGDGDLTDVDLAQLGLDQPMFINTGLTGKNLKRAQVEFDPQSGQPIVSLQFDNEGRDLFAQITERNLGQQVAIYLDGELVSAPVVQDTIKDGQAVISGSFTTSEAKELARRLNSGALPVPIELISQQEIGASLGEASVEKSLVAGIIGLFLVAIFMVAYYRLPGLLSVFALIIYTLIVFAIFKLLPVTLTLSGIAGFILSVGMAVDANVLIFERIKEELREGRGINDAIEEGFKHAWKSIRDSNVSTIITSLILAWFGTSIIKGFAITLGIGTVISMFSAITITRTFLRLTVSKKGKNWLYGSVKKGHEI